jgi:hypothetical protein
MRTNCEFKPSRSSGAMNQRVEKIISARETAGCNPSKGSSGVLRFWRSAWSLTAGLLILGFVAAAVLATPGVSSAAEVGIGVSVRVGPPPLPVYAQPICPGPGYIWTPGYWAYDPADGYYWVPGTWVMAPTPGFLWTPGYWGWGGEGFIWHVGYWGPHVGFYGGINYGFGYTGMGYHGGYWRGRSFFYNREVNNINVVRITNVYSRPVGNHFRGSRVSFNGGPGGINARPRAGEMTAGRDRHFEATGPQRQHEMAAHGNRAQFSSVNHGRPQVAATGRPGEFRGGGAAQGGGWTKFSGSRGPERGSTGNSAGARGPNPGGGGAHQAMSSPSSSSSRHEYGKPQGGTPRGQSPAPHSEYSRGSAPTPQTPGRQAQPQQHNSRPAGGGKAEGRQPESRRRS